VTVVASPGFLESHPLKVPAELAAMPLIIDESMAFTKAAPNWPEWFAHAGVAQDKEVRGLRFNHADHAIDAAARGVGVALARTSLAQSDLEKGLLVEPFPDLRLTTSLAFYLVMPPTAVLKPKVAAFTRWIHAELGLPYGER
jgi:LysR family glycine cleavage system transcriptional activator